MLEDKAATDVKQEVALAVEAAGPPAQSLLSRLAGATPGALGCFAAAAEKVLKRKADLISSPSLPHHLQPVLQGRSSLSEVSLTPQCTLCLCSVLETWALCHSRRSLFVKYKLTGALSGTFWVHVSSDSPPSKSCGAS